jgi:hypothetical protein
VHGSYLASSEGKAGASEQCCDAEEAPDSRGDKGPAAVPMDSELLPYPPAKTCNPYCALVSAAQA